MKNVLRAAVLTAAVAGVPVYSFAQAVGPNGEPPATQPAKGQAADVPVRAVVLFSSGVGYFEHYGSVKGDGSTELRFKTNQINDILKSLILQDLDGGSVNTIQYPSQDPIAKTLRSFQIDITSNPPLSQLLNQLRGAQVTIVASGDTIAGTVLGAEAHRVQPKPDQPVIEVWRVNILSGAVIRQVEINSISLLKLEDMKLQDELNRALAALASARDQDKKPVTINFTGQGERRVRLGYVVETPIWKTSYRLILGKTDVPATRPAGDDGAPIKSPHKLQGWAIVENQTDNDWNSVQLSLVSGRPISFVQDLYQPLYIPRPVVQPELYASLKPQTYEGADKAEREKPADFNISGGAVNTPAPAAAPQRARQQMQQMAQKRLNAAEELRAEADGDDAVMKSSMDAASSVRSIASAAKMGELFQYTVGNVSLPRQKSAMIPIITDDIEVEKLSIYNQSVLAKNPLNGARVKNTTGKHLLQGPITVLDGAAYAGDARIDNVPPGQERLLSYGIDLQMTVDAADQKHDQSLLTGKIVKGVLYLTHRNVNEQTYVAHNKGDAEKTLVIEHPRMGGWKLIDEGTKPDETTEQLYRYKGKVAPGKSSKLVVKQEFVNDQVLAILNADISTLVYYVKRGEIPQPVRDALSAVIARKNEIVEIDRQINEKAQRVNSFAGTQQRIRENIKIQEGEARRRLQTKLDQQETEIDTLDKEIQQLKEQRQTKQAEFEKSLEGINVG